MPSSVHAFLYLHKVFCDIIIIEEMHERKQNAKGGGSV